MRFSSSKWALLSASLASACGGATKPAESTEAPDRSSETARSAGQAEGDASDDTRSPEAPPRATCDDGTCSPCGDALCPTGWYCDETAPGGPSCGWLPECAQKSGCACLKKGLGCSCEEKNGGAYVSCR